MESEIGSLELQSVGSAYTTLIILLLSWYGWILDERLVCSLLTVLDNMEPLQ